MKLYLGKKESCDDLIQYLFNLKLICIYFIGAPSHISVVLLFVNYLHLLDYYTLDFFFENLILKFNIYFAPILCKGLKLKKRLKV